MRENIVIKLNVFENRSSIYSQLDILKNNLILRS